MGNKSDSKDPTITEFPIPEFNGWTQYGYWLNGRLLNRAEYKKQFGVSNPLRRVIAESETKKGQPEHFRSWRRQIIQKHASRPHRKLPEASRGMEETKYHIPTLNDWGAL
jgi:hypothetical protein